MAVRFSIIDYGVEPNNTSLFITGHSNEGSIEEIDEIWELVEASTSLDVIPIKIIHYIYTGDDEVLTRDATEEEIDKLMEEAYNMYREGIVVVSGGYELELVGSRREEIIMSKERGVYE